MRKKIPIEDRLRAKIAVDQATGCHVWMGATHEFGYGIIGLGGRSAGVGKTHRVAYAIAHGEIPEGKMVLHECDNPPCCNPDHLFLGTQLDNMRDMSRKGRHSRPAAKLSEDQVRQVRKAKREGETNKSISRRFGIMPRQIRRIASREQWNHVD